jgi:allantoinase
VTVPYDLVVRSRRTVLPDGERPAAVAVRAGRIAAVAAYDAPLTGRQDVELGDLALLPGLVDSHVHVNEPGRTEWEGFATATRAAAAGGVTTIVDMPLNCIPPTVTTDALAVKRSVAEGRCAVDTGFWGGAVPGNRAALRGLHDAGVFGFKCFLSPSGVEEFPALDEPGLRTAMTEIAGFGGLLIAHAEDPGHLSEPDGPGYAEFLASRPPGAEHAAIERVARLAAETGCRAHIVHLSDAGSLPLLAGWRARGARISAETCPHYLTLAAEEVPEDGTEFKCCPPIRDAGNREALWRALADGQIACVVSDHSPCVPELKKGGFDTAWGGISSLQLGLPVIWTAARARGHGLADVARWMAAGPAGLIGLSAKGRIEEGRDADLVAFAPDRAFVVDSAALRQRHPVTPYAGRELTGVVETVWLRGETAGRGRLLRRHP